MPGRWVLGVLPLWEFVTSRNFLSLTERELLSSYLFQGLQICFREMKSLTRFGPRKGQITEGNGEGRSRLVDLELGREFLLNGR